MGYKSSMEPNLVNPWLRELLWKAYKAGMVFGNYWVLETVDEVDIKKDFNEWLFLRGTLSGTGDFPEVE